MMIGASVHAHDRLSSEALVAVPQLNESNLGPRRIVDDPDPSNPVELCRKRNARTVFQVAALSRGAHHAGAIVAKPSLGLKSGMVGRK